MRQYAQTSFGCLDTIPQTGEALLAPNLGDSPSSVTFNLRISRSLGSAPRLSQQLAHQEVSAARAVALAASAAPASAADPAVVVVAVAEAADSADLAAVAVAECRTPAASIRLPSALRP